MIRLNLEPTDHRHTALVDELAAEVEDLLAGHDWRVRSAVLSLLVARLAAKEVPTAVRRGFIELHVEMVVGVVELFEREAADRPSS